MTQYSEDRKWQFLINFFLCSILGILPFIVYQKMVRFDPVFQYLYQKMGHGNYFAYYRSVWFLIFVFSAFPLYIFFEKLKKNSYNFYLVTFGYLATLSTIFSKFKETAIWGDSEKFEGLLVWLGYMAIVFLFIQWVNSLKKLKLMLMVLVISSGILALVGASQYLFYDYFFDGFAQEYLTPGEYQVPSHELDKKKTDGIILTFGNSNYTGSYMTMLVVLTFVLVFVPGRIKYLFLIVHCLLYLNLLVCFSRSAFWGTIAAMVFAVIFLKNKVIKNKRLGFLLLIVYLVTPFFLDAYSLRHGKSRFFNSGVFGKKAMGKRIYLGNFDYLMLNGNSFETSFDNIQLNVEYIDGEIIFLDSSKQKILYRLVNMAEESKQEKQKSILLKSSSESKLDSKEKFLLNKKKPFRVIFNPEQIRGFEVFSWPDESVLKIGRGRNFFLVRHTSEGFFLLNQTGEIAKIKEIDSVGFKGYEKFASCRGYIWSRTLPLLKKTIFLGNGPNTFAANFPNHDYIGKLKYLPSGYFRVIDKPHSFYFQVAHNTGFLSLLVLLIMFFLYFVESIKILYKNELNSFEALSSLALLAAIIAYLIAAFFNDSVVSVAPTFWSIFGLGIAANQVVKYKADEAEG